MSVTPRLEPTAAADADAATDSGSIDAREVRARTAFDVVPTTDTLFVTVEVDGPVHAPNNCEVDSTEPRPLVPTPPSRAAPADRSTIALAGSAGFDSLKKLEGLFIVEAAVLEAVEPGRGSIFDQEFSLHHAFSSSKCSIISCKKQLFT